MDIGDKRIGIAYGDSSSKIASPICVLYTADILQKSKNFMSILKDYMPEFFVFGLPQSLDGSQGKQADKIKEQAKKISEIYNIEYQFVDERLSSIEAKKILKEQGLTEKQMRGKVDSVAASLFLETWLKSCEV